MNYRPEIDGLRAVAVLPVILFHAGWPLFSGGFLGVDVFFVISGYLITTIILTEFSKKQFSLVGFYERRMRRILPALFLVILVSIPFSWFLMSPPQFKDFGESVAAVSLFSSNILFWLESDYFAAAAEEKPLLHTWTLAVEEQYYLFFPLFMLIFWRFGKKYIFILISILAILSLGLAEYAAVHHPVANFFLIPTRAWELFAGSLCAFLLFKKEPQANNILAIAGLGLIIIPIFLYNHTTPYPSLFTLIPVLGTALIILYGHSKTWVGQTLSIQICVGLGLISYSAYLWHQPLFAYARIMTPYKPNDALMAFLIVLSIGLAYLSWRFVEQPFRNKEKPFLKSRHSLFLTFGVLSLVFIAFGYAAHITKGFEKVWLSMASAEKNAIYEIIKNSQIKTIPKDNKDCIFRVKKQNAKINDRILSCYKKYNSGIAIIGDSHANNIFETLQATADHTFIIGISQGFCRPGTHRTGCQYDAFASFVETHPEVFSKVVYVQAGFHLLKSPDFFETSRRIFSDLSIDDEVPLYDVNQKAVDNVIGYLEKIAAKTDIIWLGSRIEPHIPFKFIFKVGCDYTFQLRQNQQENFVQIDEYLKKRLQNHDIAFLSQIDLMDFDIGTEFMTCEKLYWRDGDHFSSEGAKYFGQKMNLIHMVHDLK